MLSTIATTQNVSTEKDSILVVDDNSNILELLTDALSYAGFKVEVATDGECAIQYLHDTSVSLILLDVMMPGIDGFETCRQILQNSKTQNIPIIFMSAISNPDNKVKGLEFGAVDFIVKPFHYQELLARIQTHLKLRSLMSSDSDEENQLQQPVHGEAGLTTGQSLSELSPAETVNQVQQQLARSEKMASLGRLVSGVAHEINNPTNFIHGNLTHIQTYTQDLIRLVNLYRQHYPEPGSEIQAETAAIDLEFIQVDLPKVLSSMKLGSDRVRELILSLRNFSRLDDTDAQMADIHAALDSTLLILSNRIKARPQRPAIEIIKDYGSLPDVECYVGLLNQVFMNILSNAIDALDEKRDKQSAQEHHDSPSKITLRTALVDEQWVSIEIVDNGSGMPLAVQKRIFEPFFTTKSIGQGTGLGMPISYQIVTERHHGRLECVSAFEKGTKFLIQIPLTQSS